MMYVFCLHKFQKWLLIKNRIAEKGSGDLEPGKEVLCLQKTKTRKKFKLFPDY